jgi:hypothetical protein
MVAYLYRMGAGFPGDVNRTHPASIEPTLIDVNSPPTAYGQAVLVDPTTQGVRPLTTTEQSNSTPLTIWGVTVRPFPVQQAQTNQNYGSAPIGAATPPTSGTMDVMTSGYIMVQIPAGQAVVKGGAVYAWCEASTGSHVSGGFEGAASSGNTVQIAGMYFNGPADANGNVEIRTQF